MHNISIASALVIKLFLGFFVFALLLRFIMQLVRADYSNPIGHFLVKVTNPALKPLRRFIPGLWGIDLSCLILIFAVQSLEIFLVNILPGRQLPEISSFILLAIGNIVDTTISLYFIFVAVIVIASWVTQGAYHPVLNLIYQLVDPLMRPIRKFMPTMSGIDLSPLGAFAVLIFAKFLIAVPILQFADPTGSYR